MPGLEALLPAVGQIGGSIVDAIFGNKAAEEQAAMQMAFATHGIRWKVKDAKKAGIHPLYALGANTVSYQPVSVGGTDFASAGANLGSAIQAMTTPKEKQDAFAQTVQALTLQKMGLENEVLASQLRMVNQPGRGPGMPGDRMIPGQGNTPALEVMTTAGGDVSISVDPKNTPAQKWEDQYGEIGGEIGGLGNLLNDFVKNNPGAVLPQHLGNELGEFLRKKAFAQDYGGRGNNPAPSKRKPAPKYSRY